MNSLTRALQSWIWGVTMPLRAATLIARNPPLIAASLLPWLLSLVLDAWLIRNLQSGLSGWIHAHAWSPIEGVAQVLAWIALLIAGVLAFSLIAGIAALPFNDWLAELTERRADPPLEPTGRVTWLGRARLLSIDLFKTLCGFSLSAVALVLSWLPGLNLLGAILACLVIAFQFLSFPQTRRHEGAWAGAAFIGRNFWACLGFGMAFGFLFALPLVSSLSLPLAVVGGTLLYASYAPRAPRAPRASQPR